MSEHETIRVRDVMGSAYVMIDGLTTVREGIQLARAHGVKALVINKRNADDEFGLVLMNDIAKKVLAKNRSPDRTNIYEIMTKPALSVQPDMNVKYCARLFERFGISRAPVIENGEIIGLVSYNNIVINGMARDDTNLV
ncbi:CBS domain-containing protein [Vibrio ostreicida]|uniref:CBS domain-containing protein n=1 Tax=Vibrio ostreicida TaxID=526588 RepID=A0ABT8BR76_9VIBR|nr:CBS domain-containing protein [Vibrio ostreicida]MDN3609327.1 CBS domain-containing protein [Vibrio ostreicida]NPD08219.1 CBS domain-containing protein [Vibrio ostreicida]